jgi:Zn-dependent protease with chaperone function
MQFLRRSLLAVISLAVLVQFGGLGPAGAKVKEVKIRGYITALTSPTSFQIEDYRITRDERVRLELDKPAGAAADPNDLKIGSLIEVKGSFNDETGDLVASKVKLLSRKTEVVDSTAILEQRPTLEQAEGGAWRGTIVADGRQIKIEPATAVSFKLNKSESREAEKAAKAKKPETKPAVDPDESDLPAAEEAEGAGPLTSLADLGPGIFMTYHGTEEADGSVLASQVVFVRNEKEKGEASLWKSLEVRETPTKPASAVPAELKIGDMRFKVLPSAEVQAYVDRVGQSLVPVYQRNLPESDPNKINFHFTVVTQKGFNAIGFPTGQVIVFDEVFQVLGNEAQLAGLLSHEIAHATQEHAFRLREHNKKRRTALKTIMFVADILGDYNMSDQIDFLLTAENGYGRNLENQADRIGLHYMVDAGYDPRESSHMWSLIDRRYGDNGGRFYWANDENNLERRSFQQLVIRNTFADLNFEAMKRNDADYKPIAALAFAANPKNKPKK